MDGESLSLLGIKGENDGPCPSLTMTQRLIGCAMCLSIGSILSLGGLSRLVSLLRGNPRPFVVYTTFGTILSLSAACFMAGPAKQMKQMMQPKRIAASITLICCIVLTLVVALNRAVPSQGALLLLLGVTQILTQAFYIFTYVPFSDKIIEAVCRWCRATTSRWKWPTPHNREIDLTNNWRSFFLICLVLEVILFLWFDFWRSKGRGGA